MRRDVQRPTQDFGEFHDLTCISFNARRSPQEQLAATKPEERLRYADKKVTRAHITSRHHIIFDTYYLKQANVSHAHVRHHLNHN